MGCVFSQESDGGNKRHKKHLDTSTPSKNYQRISSTQAKSTKPTVHQQPPPQQYFFSPTSQQNVSGNTPTSTATIKPQAISSTPSSNLQRGTSPEKEEDIHFRRQHFDRNSVLRHSKKRSRKAQSPYAKEAVTSGEKSVDDPDNTENERTLDTSQTSSNKDSEPPKRNSVHAKDQNSSNSLGGDTDKESKPRALTAADIVKEEMLKFEAKLAEKEAEKARSFNSSFNDEEEYNLSRKEKSFGDAAATDRVYKVSIEVNGPDNSGYKSLSSADHVKSLLSGTTSTRKTSQLQQQKQQEEKREERSRTTRSRTRSRSIEKNVSKIEDVENWEAENSSKSSPKNKNTAVNGNDDGRLI